MTLQEPASHTPARVATQLLLIWLYGTMVVQRVVPLRILACLPALGTTAGTLLEAAMLTGRWPAPIHTRLAVAIVAPIFGLVPFARIRLQQRART